MAIASNLEVKMKTEAAILWEVGAPWSIEEVELDDPSELEVRVRLASSGLCHSDEHLTTGDLPAPLPIVGGHEGAGIVEAVGSRVTTLREGDHVVLGFIPSCGRCVACASGHQNLCESGASILSGEELAGGQRIHVRGQGVGTMCCLGTFSPYVIAHENSTIKIDDNIPLDKASLVGCGVTTGVGSVIYAGGARPGDTVVVVGCGGIGSNALQGARIAGAAQIVGVDPIALKRDQAKIFGATHTAASLEEAKGLVEEITRGKMADVAVIATGVATGDLIAPTLALIGKNGTAVVTAIASWLTSEVSLSLLDMTLYEKVLKGSLFGSATPRVDIPKILDWYMKGQFLLDELITKSYTLEHLNDGYQDLRDGTIIRGMIQFG
jgi:S-(hydroxymethyl)glutathione dehydrogenase/alcohol dehydrogenase